MSTADVLSEKHETFTASRCFLLLGNCTPYDGKSNNDSSEVSQGEMTLYYGILWQLYFALDCIRVGLDCPKRSEELESCITVTEVVCIQTS